MIVSFMKEILIYQSTNLYHWTDAGFIQPRIFIYILWSPHMKGCNQIFSKVPTSIHKNVAFVVDSSKLADRTDFVVDEG